MTACFKAIIGISLALLFGCSDLVEYEVEYEAPEKIETPEEENVETPFREKTDTYYLDAEGGDNSNDGKSPERAWKSLSKVADIKLLPGDQVLLKRGCLFNEILLINESQGSKKQQITVSTYGSGD